MKAKPSLIYLFFFLFSLSANAVSIEVQHHCFLSEESPFVELNFHIPSDAISYQKVDSSTYQGQVELTILFYQAETIVQFDKILLKGPMTKVPISFLDVKRYHLPKGKYKYEITAKDPLGEKDSTIIKKEFELNYSPNSLSQSSIQLLSKAEKASDHTPAFVKNGIFMEPLVDKIYRYPLDELIFYHEIYHAQQSLQDAFAVRYSIMKKGEELVSAYKRQEAKTINPILIKVGISNLLSGHYTLKVELRDRNNEKLMAQTTEFVRINKDIAEDVERMEEKDLDQSFVRTLTEEKLQYSLRAIASRVLPKEVSQLNEIIAGDSRLDKEKFLLAFFNKHSPQNTNAAYQTFMTFVKRVDVKFKSGLGYGFETDRGITYMKYGPPNDLIDIENEPDAPPYEIWIYYDFPSTRQTNVKFLFYNPNLTPGDYQILHSTALGEVNNPQWQLELYRKVADQVEGSNYFDATSVRSGVNRRAAEYFSDF